MPPEEFISEEEGKARLGALIDTTRRIQAEINQDEVGRVEEVLVEKVGKDPGFMLGRTRRNKVVVFPGGEGLGGEYRYVRLDRTTGATFVGSLAEKTTRELS
jgi:tRNA A37 methylthiotransferase MiaB